MKALNRLATDAYASLRDAPSPGHLDLNVPSHQPTNSFKQASQDPLATDMHVKRHRNTVVDDHMGREVPLSLAVSSFRVQRLVNLLERKNLGDPPQRDVIGNAPALGQFSNSSRHQHGFFPSRMGKNASTKPPIQALSVQYWIYTDRNTVYWEPEGA